MKGRRAALLDLLAERFPGADRERLLARILGGEVYVQDERVRDPARRVPVDSAVELHRERKYVSRGGDKLEPVLREWSIPTAGRVFLDAGASTGGFTDCLLRHGAALVYAVDVGYNQLAYELRQDPRVRIFERCNIMELDAALLDPPPHVAFADLSFRSIVGAASRLLALTAENRLVALVKPQFEWRRPAEGFTGVVQSGERVLEIASEVVERLWRGRSYVTRVALSQLRGSRGNRELFFMIEGEEFVEKGAILRRLGELLTGGSG